MKSGSFAHYFSMTLIGAYQTALADGHFPVSHVEYEHHNHDQYKVRLHDNEIWRFEI